jgi:alpha-glucosidase
LRQEVRCAASPTGVVLQFGARSGAYRPWWKEIAVTVHGWLSPSAKLDDGRTITADPRSHTISFTIADQAAARDIAIRSN